MYRTIRNLFIGFAVLVTYLMVTAASEASQTTALAIAGVVGVLLPFGLKLVPAAGHWMIAITLGASLLTAVVAELVTGELVVANLQQTDAGALLTLFLSVWGLSQVVYQSLNQHPTTTALVN